MSRFMVCIRNCDCKSGELSFVFSDIDTMDKHLLELRRSGVISSDSLVYIGLIRYFGSPDDYLSILE